MKKKLSILFLLMVVLTGCQEPMKMLVGSYSYKTSGIVEIGENQVVLPNESGALEIQQDSENELRLVFNQLNGGVYTTTATLAENVITLEPLSRTITVNLVPYELEVTGSGDYKDGVIVFTLHYEGTSLLGESTLVGEDILMIAKKNGK